MTRSLNDPMTQSPDLLGALGVSAVTIESQLSG